METLIGKSVEWSTITGYDYDGVLQAIETGPEGRWLVLAEVRKRNWMDDTNREGGAHETISLEGERRVRAEVIVEIGPCSYPRPE